MNEMVLIQIGKFVLLVLVRGTWVAYPVRKLLKTLCLPHCINRKYVNDRKRSLISALFLKFFYLKLIIRTFR